MTMRLAIACLAVLASSPAFAGKPRGGKKANKASPCAEARYTAVPLEGILDAVAISETGLVAGSDRQSALLWDGKATTRLPAPDGQRSDPSAVNDAGQVGGNIQGRAVLWQGGKAGELGTGGVHGLNNRGLAVGRAVGGGNELDRCVAWENGRLRELSQPTGGKDRWGKPLRRLATLELASCWIDAVNERGQMVGHGSRADGSSVAFLLDGGKLVELGALDGGDTWPRALNGKGQVVGTSGRSRTTGQGRERAFLWQDGKMTDLSPLLEAMDINDAGQVVGKAELEIGGTSDHRAVLWQDGKVTVLENAVDGCGWFLSAAYGINNRGQIVGSGDLRKLRKRDSRAEHGYVLTPK